MWSQFQFYSGSKLEGSLSYDETSQYSNPPDYMFYNGIVYSRRTIMDGIVEYMRFSGSIAEMVNSRF
jgi:hypothetical protein